MLDRRAELVLGALAELGYEPAPSRMPGAIGMRKRGATDFDVYVVELDGPEWKRATELRDYLRHHGDDARAYGRGLKEAEASALRRGRPEAYEVAKAGLIAKLVSAPSLEAGPVRDPGRHAAGD